MNTLWLSLLIIAECIGLYCATHALLNKKNAATAFSWITVNLLLPFIGPTMYYLFGINRIQRKAIQLRNDTYDANAQKTELEHICSEHEIHSHFRPLAKLSSALSERPLVVQNSIELLQNGEQAYPSMLSAIECAQQHIYLSSYIFDTDHIGRQFIDALANAQKRGVCVKVLIDSYGEAFQIPWASTLLKKKGVDTICFLPIFPIPRINLRNHKKILVIDGKTAFTGGMNISARHLIDNDNPNCVIDAHFRLQGPIVQQIEFEFISDWHFVSNEKLPLSFTKTNDDPDSVQQVICRALSDGPDNDVDIFIETLISAFAIAHKSIHIMTPYFIPSTEIITCLKAAAKRGVNVALLLSSKTDLPYINWASQHILDSLIVSGVNVYYQPAPFVHTKLILVDDYYAQIGSVNIDPRSLKLNFELAVEVFNTPFSNQLKQYFKTAIQQSTLITLDKIKNRPCLIKIRDAFAWLFSPYL